MVELWRCDSWVPPLLGGEDLQLLRTDTDLEGAGEGPEPACAAPASGLARTASTAALAARGSCKASSTAAATPVLRGAAGRAAGRPVTTDTFNALYCSSYSLSPRAGKLSSVGMLPADLGCLDYKSPLAWEDEDLPIETAWMFDPSTDPADSLVYGGQGGLLSSEEPESPASVYYAVTKGSAACDSAASASSSPSACSDADDLALAGEVEGKHVEMDGPECSADTSSTQLRSREVPSLTPSRRDTASGPAEDSKHGDSATQELTSRPQKKSRRSTAASRGRAPPPPAPPAPVKASTAKGAASGGVKKQKGRQSCVQCFTFTTPQWREGPMGARTLCNACGVRYRKQLNQAKKSKSGK